MTAINISDFGGMLPIKDDKLLAPNMSSMCKDTWLYDGTLKGLKPSTLLYTVLDFANTKKVYRIPNDMTPTGPHDFSNSTWMEFTDPDTDVFKAPVINDSFQRFYWASPTTPPRFNTFARIQAGNVGANISYKLGVPFPPVAPVVTPSGGISTTPLVRAYVYTWVNAYGEEGPPSVSTLSTGILDSLWNLTFTAPSVADLTDIAPITKVRIYRTVTAITGVATFSLVVELPVATLTYADTIADTVVTGAGTLPSTTWTGPPALQGLAVLPNGMMAGWIGRDIYFCEPYRPHAWPAGYTISVESPIVGLGVLGTTLFIATTGRPYTASGVNPNNVTLSKIPIIEPCTSRGSILSTLQGVFYASKNGVIMASPGLVTNAFANIIDYRHWRETIDPYSIRFVKYQNGIMGLPSAGAPIQTGFLSDISSEKTAFALLSVPYPVQSVTTDAFSGEAFILYNGGVYLFDDTRSNIPGVFEWHSKDFRFNPRINLAAMRVYFETLPNLPVLTTEVIQPTALNSMQWGIIMLYQEGELIWSREIRVDGEIFMLPSGYKSNDFRFTIIARVEVTAIDMATSIKELGSVQS